MQEPGVISCYSALVKLFIDNRPRLLKAAMQITGCPSRAEDVVQEAFFRLPACADPSTLHSPTHYLITIVRNLARDMRRKQAVEQRHTGSEEEGLMISIPEASPENIHFNRMALETIDKAIKQLSARDQYAFKMYRLKGVKQKDIAKELGLSPTMVNFIIRDAMIHCRKVLRNEGFESILS